MRTFLAKKATRAITRRELAARRQTEAHETVPVQSYRKNRTLNSRHAASPMEASERLESHRLFKRRRLMIRRLIGAICGLAIVVGLLFQLTVNISIQTPDPRSSRHAAKYIKALNEYYAARPIERFRFFLDSNSVEKFFLQKAPEVKSIRVEGDSLASSSVKLMFRQPVAQWSSGGKLYFVDDRGVTFEQNYFDTPGVEVRDESGVPTKEGQEVINRQFLSFLGQAVSLFSQHKLQVSEVVLPVNTVRQVWFKIEGRPYAIKMTVDKSAQAQVTQAITTMQHLDARGLSVSEYIDVRVDRRSFYK